MESGPGLADAVDPAWIRDQVVLDPSIRPQPPAQRTEVEPPQPLNEVLLTGATGFLGAHLLDQLLHQTSVRVHCLVRCKDEADGLRRIRKTTSAI